MRIARFAIGGEARYGVISSPGDARGNSAGSVAQPGSSGPAAGGTAAGTPAAGGSGSPGDGLEIAELAGHPLGMMDAIRFTGKRYQVADVRLLAPVLPAKIVAIGRNYAAHAKEMGNEVPDEPVIFLKPSTSVVGPSDAIVRPVHLSERVDYEGELAVVIGKISRGLPPERAMSAVFGYTCANDVTARDLQATDVQWARAKGFDTFCPLGPWVETELDPSDLEITTTVNGEKRQQSRTSLLLHGVPALISYVSAVMTLLPGDVLLTGTPDGVGPLAPGDEVSVTVEGIGTLSNRVVNAD
jgi:2-keto-4-pentenoate hydratase/2-oxohepta-3-ene-1,7-dioic acid hydratase in catechol pathway